MSIDTFAIQRLAPQPLAAHLRQLVKSLPEESISSQLFLAVEHESLPPTVLEVWLSLSSSTDSLLSALKQEFSVYTRQVAIKWLFKRLRRKDWRDTWDGIGRVSGLLSLFELFSVSENMLCVKKFSCCANGPDRAEKQELIFEVLRGLLPRLYPDAQVTTLDERPLLSRYLLLLAGCKSNIVDDVFRDRDNPLLSSGVFDSQINNNILREHYQILREHCLEQIFDRKKPVIKISCYLPSLLHTAPPIASSEPGFSESMAFSRLVLRRLVKEPKANFNLSVLTELVEPLLVRAQKKKVSSKDIKEIFVLAVQYVTAHPSETRYITWSRDRFLHRLIRSWAASPSSHSEYEPLLGSLFSAISWSHKSQESNYSDALLWVKRPFRYKFLQLLFLHNSKESIDIDDEKSLKRAAIAKWPCIVFQRLERGDAVALLNRIRRIHSQEDFLQVGSGILTQPAEFGLSSPDSSILMNVLEYGVPGVVERATASVDELRKKSVISREQTERAFYAKSALFCAISSGSLELYGETILWIRRYIKDPLTVKVVFSKAAQNNPHAVDLISGIPQDIGQSLAHDISRGIKIGNEIVLDSFETACLALKEPSFFCPDWVGPLTLVGDVVSARINGSARLQKALNLSDDELYELLWNPTLAIVVQIEKLCLLREHKKLGLQNPLGMVKADHTTSKIISPALFRFLDHLARIRDDMWRAFRLQLDSNVAILPSTLPRGLPIQYLTHGFDIAVQSGHGRTPWISARAQTILASEPDDLLSPVPDTTAVRKAIGVFVDSFSLALQIHVLQQNSPDERQARAMQIWTHNLKHLSDRMPEEDAYLTWKRIFLQSLPEFVVPDPVKEFRSPVPEYPLFPFDADVTEYTEWNPIGDYEQDDGFDAVVLSPLTYLDCVLTTSPSFQCPEQWTKFRGLSLCTEGRYIYGHNIWSPERLPRYKYQIPVIREGMNVSALLYLEHLIPAHTSLLSKPYPSPTSIRYPPIWLDLSFTDDIEGISPVDMDSAFTIVKKSIHTVPPSLLHKLTEVALEKLFSPPPDTTTAELAELEKLAYGFLSLLVKCDRPSLAINFILKIVIEKPDSSAWHRQLLTTGYLRSLSATQAKFLIQSFSEAIKAKSKEAAAYKRPIETSKNAAIPEKKSYIKVTTIKYLAQLLQGSDFVPESFSLAVLTELFQVSTHVDVRVAIVESVIGMLSNCSNTSSEKLGHRLLDVLKSTIPTAASFNERYHVGEAEWEAAEATGDLPSIFVQGSDPYDMCIAPILQAIMDALDSGSLGRKWENALLKQVLVPILENSIANNARYLAIFFAKHGLDFTSLSLPQLPIKPRFLADLLRKHYGVLPASLMDLFHAFIIVNVSPTDEIKALITKLEDPGFRKLPETKHFLSLYGHGPSLCTYSNLAYTSLLRQKWPYPESLITVQQLQQHAFDHAVLLIKTNRPDMFESVIQSYAPISSWSIIESENWLHNAKAVLERIISAIEIQRTETWQRDLNRQPRILPSTLIYRLWLLPYPTPRATDTQLLIFVAAWKDFVKEICEPGKLYHEELPEVTKVASRIAVVNRAKIACLLGKLNEMSSVVDLICLEFAKSLFLLAGNSCDEVVVLEAEKAVRNWVESPNERIRANGIELARKEGILGRKGKFLDFN